MIALYNSWVESRNGGLPRSALTSEEAEITRLAHRVKSPSKDSRERAQAERVLGSFVD